MAMVTHCSIALSLMYLVVISRANDCKVSQTGAGPTLTCDHSPVPFTGPPDSSIRQIDFLVCSGTKEDVVVGIGRLYSNVEIIRCVFGGMTSDLHTSTTPSHKSTGKPAVSTVPRIKFAPKSLPNLPAPVVTTKFAVDEPFDGFATPTTSADISTVDVVAVRLDDATQSAVPDLQGETVLIGHSVSGQLSTSTQTHSRSTTTTTAVSRVSPTTATPVTSATVSYMAYAPRTTVPTNSDAPSTSRTTPLDGVDVDRTVSSSSTVRPASATTSTRFVPAASAPPTELSAVLTADATVSSMEVVIDTNMPVVPALIVRGPSIEVLADRPQLLPSVLPEPTVTSSPVPPESELTYDSAIIIGSAWLVGVLFAAILLFALWYCRCRRRRLSAASSSASGPPTNPSADSLYGFAARSEGIYADPAELSSPFRSAMMDELDGPVSGSRLVHTNVGTLRSRPLGGTQSTAV